jgi:hypothetical protein
MHRIKRPALTMVILAMLLVAAFPIQAQGLDQTFEWPQVGLTMAYPADWYLLEADAETAILSADPDVDPQGDSLPNAPTIVITALSTELLDALGSPEQAMNLFASEFGEADAPVDVSFAGYEGLRMAIPEIEAGIGGDFVMLIGEDYLVFFLSFFPDGAGADFAPLFESMLDSITLTAAASSPATDPTAAAQTTDKAVLINGVRISLDQSIGGSWNEIDAVELVGMDASGSSFSQWASDATATSEYGSDSWSAAQATGAPDTETCGDLQTAWASATSTGQDALTLTYAQPVAASTINIHQTYNPGSITMVELLPADGSAPIVVFEGVDATTDCPGVFSLDVSTGGGTLTYEETVSGTITDTAYSHAWTFTGSAGDTVTITMSAAGSSALDSYLYLLDAEGTTLATNDDADASTLGAFDSQIAGFTLPADGTYTILATRYGEDMGTATGDYTLTLSSGASAMAAATTISYGESISGMLDDNVYEQDYGFTASAGDVVTITMVDDTEELDPYLYLLDAEGNILIENDDATSPSVGGYNAQIADFAIPTAGTYIIRATRFGGAEGTSAGNYSLTLDQSGAVEIAGTLAYGDSITSTIDDTTYFETWAFDGQAGDSVTISMVADDTSDLDPYLMLFDPSGIMVAENDDNTADSTYNSAIPNIALSESGTYTIRATRFGGAESTGSGTYTLSLSSSK